MNINCKHLETPMNSIIESSGSHQKTTWKQPQANQVNMELGSLIGFDKGI